MDEDRVELINDINNQIAEIDKKLAALDEEEKKYKTSIDNDVIDNDVIDNDLLYGTDGMLDSTKNAIANKRKLEVELLAKKNNISYQEAKKDYLEKLKQKKIVDDFFEKDFEFVLELFEGDNKPKALPDYKYKIDFKITPKEDKSYAIFDGKEYVINGKKYNKIKEYISQNISELVTNSINENHNYIVNNGIFDTLYVKKLKIRFGKLIIELDGNVNGNIADYYNKIANYIINIVISDDIKPEININDTINKLVEKISNMESNTEFTFASLIDNKEYYDFKNYNIMDIMIKVYNELNNRGIKVISKFGKDAVIGLPQNMPYIKQ